MIRALIFVFCAVSTLNLASSSFHSDDMADMTEEEKLALAWIQQLNLTANNKVAQSRQIAPPTNPISFITDRIPCQCDNGICKCCTGPVALLGLKSCMEVFYQPEEFSFELRMKVNDRVMFKRKVSGRNPPPLCFTPPRLGFIKACITFYDIYFFGTNMNVCMELSGSFQGYDVFQRPFDCLRLGDKGVKVVKPGEEYPFNSGYDSIIDASVDDIEDYDENFVRSVSAIPE